jgi:hypothetical protein
MMGWFWFQPDKADPTTAALKASLTSSFGSICLGSLIVALLKIIRNMVRQAARDQGCLGCIAVCLIQCIENLVELFNYYAYTQVALYGKSFTAAARDTWNLVKSRGLDLLINHDLSDAALFVGALTGAALCAGVAAIWATSADYESWVRAISRPVSRAPRALAHASPPPRAGPVRGSVCASGPADDHAGDDGDAELRGNDFCGVGRGPGGHGALAARPLPAHPRGRAHGRRLQCLLSAARRAAAAANKHWFTGGDARMRMRARRRGGRRGAATRRAGRACW